MYHQRKYQYVASKWQKMNLLVQDKDILPYMPDTRPLTKQNLLDMLELYPMLYIKPDYGMKGKGIFRLTKIHPDHDSPNNHSGFTLQSAKRTLHVSVLNELYAILAPYVQRQKFVIQKGIEVIHLGEHPIDFRILMQRPKQKWTYCGIVGKLGEKNSIVTNYASGGKAIPFGNALHQTLYIGRERIKELRDLIRSICYKIAYNLSKKYPGLRELGIDAAIDIHGDIWILEVNTTPGHQLFRGNSKLYKRIVRNIQLINRQY